MTTEEKWLAMPDYKKLEVLDNIEHLVELHKKQNDLLDEMRRSLLWRWMKGAKHLDIIMDTNKVDEAGLMRLLRAYYKAIEDGRTQFEFDGRPVLVSYAKYLIEFLETEMTRMGIWPTIRVNTERSRHRSVLRRRAEQVNG